MYSEKRITTVEEVIHELTFLKEILEKFSAEDAKEAEKQTHDYFEGRFTGSSSGFRLSAQWLDEIIQNIEVKE